EGIHPLESGLFRYKFRRDRRPGLPIEPRWKFYPKYAVESAVKMAKWFKLWARLRGVYVKIKRDPKKWEYTDLALTPVTDEEVEAGDFPHPFRRRLSRRSSGGSRRTPKRASTRWHRQGHSPALRDPPQRRGIKGRRRRSAPSLPLTLVRFRVRNGVVERSARPKQSLGT